MPDFSFLFMCFFTDTAVTNHIPESTAPASSRIIIFDRLYEQTAVVSKEDILGKTIGYDEAETYKPIVQRIFENSLKHPDDPAIIANDTITTYSELTESVYQDGWFVSSDIGTLDEEGYLYYVGRKDDVINLGGYKIAPTEVESLALQSGIIEECICIEEIDEYNVNYIKLLVTVKDKDHFDPSLLNAYLSERLEMYKIPRTIEAVDELKKTFNGKNDRKAYRKKR